MLPYLAPSPELLRDLGTDAERGLSSAEAADRLRLHGPNRLRAKAGKSPLRLLAGQFADLLILLLVGAGSLALYLGERRDASILFAIVLFNAANGFYQEFKAERILQRLRNLVVAQARVIRDGRETEVPSDSLVPGDIVLLSEGDGVPADIRLLSSTGFSTNDVVLTGEADPQPKSERVVLTREVEVTDRNNCVFAGTTVARGEARGVVFATGMGTAIGVIAQSSEGMAQPPSPLQREINALAQRITRVALTLSALLLTTRFLLGDAPRDALVFAIGIAASMVPQGLPSQINVALSLGVGRMARKNALVKQLSAVEALGAASVIASDKTGTITKNEMTITHCAFDGQQFSVTGTGYAPEGQIIDADGRTLSRDNLGDLKVFFLDGYLSSTGRVNPPDAQHALWYALGDPTEAAFATLAMKAGYDLSAIDREYPRLALFPFDSDRKRMSIVRQHKGKRIVFAKGAIESILPICTHDISNGSVTELTDAERSKLLQLAAAYSSESLRVIAVAYKDLEAGSQESEGSWETKEQKDPSRPTSDYRRATIESGLTFAGFVTMLDPPHEEVREAVRHAFDAQVRLVMITGDNAATARAVAAKIGMTLSDGSSPLVIEGDRLPSMTDAQLRAAFGPQGPARRQSATAPASQPLSGAAPRAVIFSRVSPSDKLRIVTLLQDMGDIVAVTGDGVNDTLSLKKADIGVAMGRMGSEVAKEAADMVLLDDNFSSIVVAVREGRTIYRNLVNTIVASLTSNFGELTTVLWGFVGTFFGLPIPITAVQILCVDLVGEMLPLTMLTLDPPEQSLMHEPPRDPRKHIMDWQALRGIMAFGLLMGSVAFASFLAVHFAPVMDPATHHQRAMTAAYMGIMLCQFMNILSRRTRRSVLTPYLWSNRGLIVSFVISIGLILTIAYLPFLNAYLSTAPLRLSDWTVPVLGALLFLCVHEMRKGWGKQQSLSRTPIR